MAGAVSLGGRPVDRVVRMYINIAALAAFSLAVVVAFALTFGRTLAFDPRQDVFIDLAETGGLVTDHHVTVLGKQVGSVHDIELTPSGVRLHIKVEEDSDVPAYALAHIIRRSAVGEQTLNLIPVAPDWRPTEERLIPRLVQPQRGWSAAEPGGEIHPRAVVMPSDIHAVLEGLEELFRGIDKGAVSTTVRELAAAVGGRGETLVDINRQAVDLNETLVAAIPDFQRLIDTSEVPLAALRDQRDSIAEMITHVADLSSILADNRPTLEGLIDDGSRTLEQLDGLVRDNRADLSCVVEDLGDLSAVTVDNRHWLEQALDLNTDFWDSWDRVYQWDPWRPGILWFRVGNLTLEESTGRFYETRRPTPATKPGAACVSEFGVGVDAVRQPDHQAPDPTSPGIDWAPSVRDTEGEPPRSDAVEGGASAARAATAPGSAGLRPLASALPAAALILVMVRRGRGRWTRGRHAATGTTGRSSGDRPRLTDPGQDELR